MEPGKVYSLRRTIVRRKKLALLSTTCTYVFAMLVGNYCITVGNLPLRVSITIGLIWGVIVLWHEADELTLWDMLVYGGCALTAPLWLGYYSGSYIVWIDIGLAGWLGYTETLIFLPITAEYRRVKEFLKSG